jgi:hypothetical protein
VFAVLVAAGIALSTVHRADAHHIPLLILGGAAVLLLALSLAAGSTSLLPWPLVLLGAAYALSLADGPIDQWAPVYAGAFLLAAELAYWSLELRGRADDVEQLTERRAGMIVALTIGAIALAGLVLAATAIRVGSGIVLDLAGVLAAVAAAFVIAGVAARR